MSLYCILEESVDHKYTCLSRISLCIFDMAITRGRLKLRFKMYRMYRYMSNMFALSLNEPQSRIFARCVAAFQRAASRSYSIGMTNCITNGAGSDGKLSCHHSTISVTPAITPRQRLHNRQANGRWTQASSALYLSSIIIVLLCIKLWVDAKCLELVSFNGKMGGWIDHWLGCHRSESLRFRSKGAQITRIHVYLAVYSGCKSHSIHECVYLGGIKRYRTGTGPSLGMAKLGIPGFLFPSQALDSVIVVFATSCASGSRRKKRPQGPSQKRASVRRIHLRSNLFQPTRVHLACLWITRVSVCE